MSSNPPPGFYRWKRKRNYAVEQNLRERLDSLVNQILKLQELKIHTQNPLYRKMISGNINRLRARALTVKERLKKLR